MFIVDTLNSNRTNGLSWNSIVFLIAAAFSCAGTLPGQEAPARIDYETQILPILENHCFECHNGGNVKGNLRLDSRAGLDERGFSGLPIVAATLDESELILRIKSGDEEFRMPKSAPALSDNEIALLSNWAAQGAPYEAAALPAKHASEERSLADRLADGYLLAQELLLQKPYRYAAIVLAPFLLYLVLVVAAIVARHQSAKRDAVAEVRFPWARLNPFLVITLICGVVTFIAFQQGQMEEYDLKIQLLEKEIASQASPQKNDDQRSQPFAPRPMHPKRMGGVYYRGNDERSDQLFNGGFYRTAKLTVQLIDETGNPVDYGAAVMEGDLAIRLQIQRSPGTEHTMFTQRSIENTFMSSSFRGTESADDRRMLQPVENRKIWEVVYPIAKPNINEIESDDHRIGTLYLYYGPLDHNRIHYLIQYNLHVKNGIIEQDSEVWMGSTYDLNGRVLVPGEGEISLQQWFDFRPIPEIEEPDHQEAP